MDKRGALSPLLSNLLVVTIAGVFIMMGLYLAVSSSPNPDAQALVQFQNSTINLNNSLTEFTNSGNNIKDMLGNSTSQVNPVFSVFLIFQAAFDIPKSLLDLAITSIQALTGILFPNLNGTFSIVIGIVMATIMAWLFIEIVLAIVSAIRTGNSER